MIRKLTWRRNFANGFVLFFSHETDNGENGEPRDEARPGIYSTNNQRLPILQFLKQKS